MQVSSEHLHFWLVSLSELSRAEESLVGRRGQTDATKGVTAALTHYVRAVSALKVTKFHSSTQVISSQVKETNKGESLTIKK